MSNENIDANPVDMFGMTPLYDAAVWGENEIIEMYVRAGADIEHTSEHPMYYWGPTALKGAAMWGYDDTVQVSSLVLPSLPPLT